MSSAPGQPESARMVLSHSGKRPLWYSRIKLDVSNVIPSVSISSLLVYVSHTVAVAECNNSLNQHIIHFQKQHKKPNVTAVGLHDIPAGCGKKGGVTPRKRRKKEAVVERVDRLQLPTWNSNMCVSTAGNASYPVAQGSGSSLVNITLDHPSSSCVPSNPYSHWLPSYYDWEFPYIPIWFYSSYIFCPTSYCFTPSNGQ